MSTTPRIQPSEHEKPNSASMDAATEDEVDESVSPEEHEIALPSHVAGSGTLDRLVDTARDYAKASTAENTNKAYAADWKHFARWCRLKGTDPIPPSPELVGLYLADLAAPTDSSPPQSAFRPLSVTTIERRLSGLSWNYTQRGFTLDRKDRHIATVLPGSNASTRVHQLRKKPSCPRTSSPWSPPCPSICVGYGTGRSAFGVCRRSPPFRNRQPRCRQGRYPDSGGWIEVLDGNDGGGVVLTLNAKTAGVKLRSGADPQSRPVPCMRWNSGCTLPRSTSDPCRAHLARRQARLEARLNDKHVARLIKATVLKSGIRAELPKSNVWPCSLATPCAPGSPVLQRLTSATFRNSLGTPPPK